MSASRSSSGSPSPAPTHPGDGDTGAGGGSVSRRAALFDRALRVLAVAYPATLLLVILALRFVGERHWATAAALYVPRVAFALPLPPLVLALLVRPPRRWLLSQVIAAGLLFFPLMGLRLPWRPAPTPGTLHLRLLTFNIATGSRGLDAIIDEAKASNADVILLQETEPDHRDRLRAGLSGYFNQVSGQFWVASRFPIKEIFEPAHVPHRGKLRSPRFIRISLTTPAGTIRVYSVHIISPRDALDELRGNGLLHELASTRLFRGVASGTVVDNTSLRVAQLQAIATDADQSPDPVLIAGDTNLPTLSWALAHWLPDYQDGFASAGSGFGYTFPAPRHPWMRIDRILADASFRFLRFDVLKTSASDHYAVVGDLEIAPAVEAPPAR